MITTGYLADHLDCIPTLISWFRGQWPAYYADWSDEEMTGDFVEDAARHRLPSRLVAFDDGQAVGTIVLRRKETGAMADYQPELGGLYVVESVRGRGIGTHLVRAGMQLARQQGYPAVYATTVTAAGILKRLGWQYLKTIQYPDGEVSLYRCDL